MKTEFFIGYRYLMRKTGRKFVSFISAISMIGIALGVMSLIVVLSVMGGFEKELKEKIIGTYPHLSIESLEGIFDYNQVIDEIQNQELVVSASPYLLGEGIIRYKEYASGIILRGIDADREKKVTNIDKYIVKGILPNNNFEIVLGSELVKQIGISLKDKVKLITPLSARPVDFTLVGIFESGMYEYDVNLVFIDLFSAQKIFDAVGLVNGIGVRIEDPYKTNHIKRNLIFDLGLSYQIKSWQDRNKNLFSALKLEKTTMFVILTLIVMVACFSIVGTLIMIVMEKTKDIGILKSLGASNRFVRKIFTYQGTIFGIGGSFLGGVLGLGICYILSEYQFISLPEDVYYINTLPVQIQWLDIGIIVFSAIFLSVIASIYPAICASKLNPADAIRYE